MPKAIHSMPMSVSAAGPLIKFAVADRIFAIAVNRIVEAVWIIFVHGVDVERRPADRLAQPFLGQCDLQALVHGTEGVDGDAAAREELLPSLALWTLRGLAKHGAEALDGVLFGQWGRSQSDGATLGTLKFECKQNL